MGPAVVSRRNGGAALRAAPTRRQAATRPSRRCATSRRVRSDRLAELGTRVGPTTTPGLDVARPRPVAASPNPREPRSAPPTPQAMGHDPAALPTAPGADE